MRRRVAALLAVCAVIVAGCASTTDGLPWTVTGPTRALDAPPGQVVFQIEHGGGYVPQEYSLGTRPSLTIYANGDAYLLESPRSLSSPGTPSQFVRGSVPVDILAGLVRDAGRSGLFDDLDFGAPRITDMGSTTVTFHPDDRAAQSASAYALGFTQADDDLTGVQRSARTALRHLGARLHDSVVAADGSKYWTPDRIDVTRFGRAADRSADAATWPGPPLDRILARAGSTRECGVLDGASARRIWTAALGHETTAWLDAGAIHNLIIRALLPGEVGCEP